MAAKRNGPSLLAIFRRVTWRLYKPTSLRVYKRGRLDLWFPHIPLAAAVGIDGLIVLLPTIHHYVRQYLHLQLNGLYNVLHPLNDNMSSLILHGVPDATVGAVQLVISLSLLLRSRIGWIAALLIMLTQVGVAVIYNRQPWDSQAVIYTALIFLALCVSGRSFQRSSLAASSLLAIAASGLLLLYGIVGSLILGQGFSPPFYPAPGGLFHRGHHVHGRLWRYPAEER